MLDSPEISDMLAPRDPSSLDVNQPKALRVFWASTVCVIAETVFSTSDRNKVICWPRLAWPTDHTLGYLLKKTCVDLARRPAGARVHHSLTSLSSRSPMISSWSMLLRSCTRCRNSSRWQPLTASLNWWGWQSIRIWAVPPGAKNHWQRGGEGECHDRRIKAVRNDWLKRVD